MAYLGRQPNTGVRSRYIYTATASQTTFSGSDDDGKTLKYEDAAYLDVFLNGVLLKPTTDYTATSKTSVVLTSAAAVSDIVEIVAYDIANIANTVSATNGGTFEADVTVQGTVTADGLTVDTNTLYVDAANNRVGIGTDIPNAPLHIEGADDILATIESTDRYSHINLVDSFGASRVTNDSGNLRLRADNANSTANSYMTMEVDGTERMRINNQGQITMGGSSHADDILYLTRSNDGKVQRFYRGASEVGYISVTSSSTSYNTSSDYRLKENVADLTGAIDRVKQVPVHRFNFITDPDKTVDGFLAHEVADVVPEAITGTKDEVDEEGNPVYQGIDQSKLVPLLTAALQEAVAKIEALEARVATLENA